MIRKFLKKFKIKSKKLLTVFILSIVEIVLILWWNSWIFTPAVFATIVQLGFILEKKDIWERLTEDEKKDILLTGDELDSFIRGVAKLINEGKTADDVIAEIKKKDD